MEQNIQIDEFEKTLDNFIFDHFKSIHGDSQDIIFFPDFRVIIILKTPKETCSYYTELIDTTKKYSINQIIKESELLQLFMKIHNSYTISVLCCFDEKNENNNDNNSILLLKKEIKSC
jgi:hypothetical protein